MGDFTVNRKKIVCLTARAFALLLVFAAGSGARAQQPGATAAAPAGIFKSHGDLGTVLHQGSVQHGEEKGAATHEIQANISAPKRLQLEKHGAFFTMWLADEKGEFHLAGGSARLTFKEPFYVGIGLCSHDKDVVEKAVFSNVDLKTAAPAADAPTTLYSVLEVITVASTDRTAIYVAPERFEAPNWMPDGKNLLFNRNGRIEKIPATGGTPQVLDTGFATRCNNDHGISPDGTQLVISDQSQEEHRSLVYIVPIGGGAPRRITQKSPSYWHGWSPDGK